MRRASTSARSFFFQAEDGIRDLTVTGVQTCALPILLRDHRDRIDRAHDRTLLAAHAVLLDDDGLPRRVRIFREGELAVHHADRLERAVVEAVRAAHADFLIDDRERAASSDVLLRADLESLLVSVLRELDVHLADGAVVPGQRI